ncbi:Sulfite exporter TauE/SafE [Vibrio mediterranei]|uniref:Probable membrane transporter protein n=1 Tax=Vibrio mediterranei TaxID=689 RepID=A0ABX5DCZ1_9VIBR|nr:sulfite exporter TauE/SafE family protein [Vibrio mediterranei]PCD88382.1 sulfite exporter TauE/SafE family protein [Vibrio mediterranei]PRQ66752.1 sulfite exporter TauE/SafE family protein [Vibrio mediterranei]SBO08053.1 Sulfite exporter TauE/SafE [Vibrio mediterranei]
MDTTLILVSLIIALAGFTQGLTGFGSALVSVPLLSFIVGAQTAVPIAGIFGWLVTLPIVWKMRHSIQRQTGLILFAGSVPASFVGAKLLATMPSQYILLTMGIVLVTSSLHSLRSTKPLFKKTSVPVTVGAGFTSGVLGASVGESGPPVIAYTSMQPWTADQTKSTLAFFFMLQMIGANVSFWNEGLITEEVLSLVMSAMPAFVIGLTGGMIGYHLLHKYKIDYHRIVHIFLLVIGCMLVAKNVHF